ILRKAGYCRHRLAQPALVDAVPNGLDDAGDLITDARGQFRFFEINAVIVHRLGAVQAGCLNLQLDFALARRARRLIFDAKNLGTTELMKANNPRHEYPSAFWMAG